MTCRLASTSTRSRASPPSPRASRLAPRAGQHTPRALASRLSPVSTRRPPDTVRRPRVEKLRTVGSFSTRGAVSSPEQLPRVVFLRTVGSKATRGSWGARTVRVGEVGPWVAGRLTQGLLVLFDPRGVVGRADRGGRVDFHKACLCYSTRGKLVMDRPPSQTAQPARSARPLQLAGPLRVALTRAEDHEPQWDRDHAEDQ